VSGAAERDLLRGVVPVVAAAVVVLAAVTDPSDPRWVVLLGAAAALFAVWALWPALPTLVLAAGVVTAVVLTKGDGALDPALFLVVLLAMVAAGWERSRWVVLLTVTAALAVPVVVELRYAGDTDVGIWMIGIGLPALMCWYYRRQEELRSQLEEARRQLLERSVAEERQRIARDVHDLVGHGLAAVLLQVSGARHVLRRDPDEAEVALRAAEDAGRRSLGELRSTVALLRAEGESAVSPVPGLHQLPRLVDEARGSGLDAELRTDGELDHVDPMVGLALYRVAQEALLNAARHAPHARTVVSTMVGEDRVELCVRSRGSLAPAPAGRAGYGLVGMRERAAAVGGELHAGPDAQGWTVRCVVPTRESGGDERQRGAVVTELARSPSYTAPPGTAATSAGEELS